jgi:hypothetical protein
MHTAIEITYIGNSTSNLLMGGQSNASGVASGYINQNKIPVGGLFRADPVTGAAAPADPDNTGTYTIKDYYPYYQGYGTNNINMLTHGGTSNYNALQVVWTKQAGDLTFNVNYTYSKALGTTATTIDAFSIRGNYGVLGIDRPHEINTSYAYTLRKPYKGSNKLITGAANGWTISGTTILGSGADIQAQTSMNLGMAITYNYTDSTGKQASESIGTSSWYGTNNGTIQPTMLCNPKSGLASHQHMNASCYGVPALGAHGLRQFPYTPGPGYFNSDLTIYKTFHIGDKQSVEFRAAAFNFLNHPLWEFNSGNYTSLSYTTTNKVNFTPTTGSNLPSGQKWGETYYKTGRRLAELTVKYHF